MWEDKSKESLEFFSSIPRLISHFVHCSCIAQKSLAAMLWASVGELTESSLSSSHESSLALWNFHVGVSTVKTSTSTFPRFHLFYIAQSSALKSITTFAFRLFEVQFLFSIFFAPLFISTFNRFVVEEFFHFHFPIDRIHLLSLHCSAHSLCVCLDLRQQQAQAEWMFKE